MKTLSSYYDILSKVEQLKDCICQARFATVSGMDNRADTYYKMSKKLCKQIKDECDYLESELDDIIG